MKIPDDLYPSLIANCVFDVFLSYTAIMFNIITILALRKTTSLPKPLKTLLLSVAVSDLGSGLLLGPLYNALLIVIALNIEDKQTYNATEIASRITGNFLVYASYFGVVALSADRFLAIHLHLRYQELVTHKRVVAVVISIWLLSAFVSLLKLGWIPVNVSSPVFTTIQVICIIIKTLFYFKIYAAVRRHANQIQAQQVQQVAQNGEIANGARQRKSAVGTFYVYLVFLACYLPMICINVAGEMSTGQNGTLIFHLSLYTNTLVILNSSLNPLIYCWKMRHIRHSVMDILRNIYPSHN